MYQATPVSGAKKQRKIGKDRIMGCPDGIWEVWFLGFSRVGKPNISVGTSIRWELEGIMAARFRDPQENGRN